MVIQSLSVVVEEHELASRVCDRLSAVPQLKDVTVGLVPDAVVIGGKFHVGFAIPFKTQWTVEVLDEGRKLGVRLAQVSVGMLGLGASTVSEQVMNALSSKLQNVAGVTVASDRIVLDPVILLAARGVVLQGPVSRVDLSQGQAAIVIG